MNSDSSHDGHGTDSNTHAIAIAFFRVAGASRQLVTLCKAWQLAFPRHSLGSHI